MSRPPADLAAHLDELALEALATGRDDLVAEASLLHLDECAECAERLALEQEVARDASLALRRAAPPLEELDAMIALAMSKAPDPAEGAIAVAAMQGAPTRRSLWTGAAVGTAAAALLAVLSAPKAGSFAGLGALGRQGLTLLRAADRVIESSVPGGWIGVALFGLLAALVLAVPTRLLLRSGPSVRPMITSSLVALALAVLSLTTTAAHAYRLEGQWPSPEPTVTVEVEDQPTSEALRQAAASAGLGVVLSGLPDDPNVTMHVSGAPISEVMEALLGEQAVLVRPGASLLTIRRDDAPAVADGEGSDPQAEATSPESAGLAPPIPAPTPATPTPPPMPGLSAQGPSFPPPPPLVIERAGRAPALGDLVTLGEDAEVGADAFVRGVYTMGGDARVLGHAYGDVVTMGGNAEIAGEVTGNVTTMGGNLDVLEGARIHGDLNAMGGEVAIHPGAELYGRVIGNGQPHVRVRREHDEDRPMSGVFRWALFNALLFLFGLVMLGASRKRFVNLRAELVSRPVRSAFGGFFGLLAGGALTVALTLSVLGLPGAIVLGMLLASGYVLGWGASAWWLGGVLPVPGLRDRPVAQLAVGVVILFLVGLIPKIGILLVIVAALAGLGAVFATSFGTVTRKPKRNHVPTGPFRTSA